MLGALNKLKKPWDFEDPLCAEVGTDVFFARDLEEEKGNRKGYENYKEAREICKRCEHIVECAEWGIKYEQYGMWGGLTPAERSKIRRKTQVVITSPSYRTVY